MKITINSKTAGKYRKAMLNNREHIVTSMVPIVADSVMNGGLYPLAEVANTFDQLDNLPAPNGHPSVNGELVSAFHPLAINAYNIGGFVKNPKMDGKKVINEFWLDVEIANQSEDGKELIRRIENGEEVGVSTGLTVRQENAEAKDYSWIARDLKFDHVAILLNERAAGEHVGTRLQTNSADLIISAVSDQRVKGMSKQNQGILARIVNAVSAVLVSNASAETVREALQQAVRATYGGEDIYVWVCDFDQEAGTVYYEVSGSESAKTFSEGFTLSADGTLATLAGSPAEVKRKTEFVPVSAPAAQQPAQQEGKTVEVQPVAPNADAPQGDADKAALDAAVKLLESKGFKVVKAEEAENAAEYKANAAAFAEFKANRKAEADDLRKQLIGNAGLTEDDVKDLTVPVLARMVNALAGSKPQSYSLAAGRAPLRVVNQSAASDGDYLSDYTTATKKEG